MLSRRDPFREMLRFRSLIDRLMEDTLEMQMGDVESRTWGLPLDVVEKENEFIVKASLPGVAPEDIDITYTDNMLTIKGEIKQEDVGESRYHLRERRTGQFSRSVSLPDVNPDGIDASFNAGVLTLRLPKIEEAKPRRISIQSGASQKMIEGKAKDVKK